MNSIVISHEYSLTLHTALVTALVANGYKPGFVAGWVEEEVTAAFAGAKRKESKSSKETVTVKWGTKAFSGKVAGASFAKLPIGRSMGDFIEINARLWALSELYVGTDKIRLPQATLAWLEEEAPVDCRKVAVAVETGEETPVEVPVETAS